MYAQDTPEITSYFYLFLINRKKNKLKYNQIPAFVSCIVISQMFHLFKQMILAYIFSMITEKRWYLYCLFYITSERKVTTGCNTLHLMFFLLQSSAVIEQLYGLHQLSLLRQE